MDILEFKPPEKKGVYSKPNVETTSISFRPYQKLRYILGYIGVRYRLSQSRVALWAARVLYDQLVKIGELSPDREIDQSLRRD